MKKQLLILLALVTVAAGIFEIRRAHAKCQGGSCSKKVRTVRR